MLTLVLLTFDFYNPGLVYLENPTEEEVTLLSIGLVGILNAIISVAGGIFFLWWFYRGIQKSQNTRNCIEVHSQEGDCQFLYSHH